MPACETVEQRHHGFHPSARGRNEGDKEIRKAKVTAMDALFSNGEIGEEFFRDRRPLEVTGGNGLRPAVGLDAWKEKVGTLADTAQFQTEWRAVGAYFSAVGFTVSREGDGDGGRAFRAPCFDRSPFAR